MPNVVPPPAYYAGERNDVFVINDIDLVVPPTNISIQKEDLIYQWRALRSKSTTKIPSGHGQIAVQLTIPFIPADFLDLHRLVVEFKHSPFCYVENRLLRESIVPHWPTGQLMAFTMTGLSLHPMQNSSDTWIAQLDLTWFNYQPYLHNWFYRKDWHTIPLLAQGGKDSPIRAYEKTIGWGVEESGRWKSRNVILPGLGFTEDQLDSAKREWSVVYDRYTSKSNRNIEDLETLHRGEVFDLMPMPGRMAPSLYVARPRDSLIYTRYMNYLQRDALKANFDIDVERDMGYSASSGSPLHSAFFNAVLTDSGQDRKTYGLHTGPPNNSSLHREWALLRQKWIGEMTRFHGAATFAFASYQELRLPDRWSSAVSEAHTRAAENALAKLEDPTGYGPWVTWYNEEDAPVGRLRVRRGWTEQNGQGKSVVTGELGSESPYTVEQFLKKVVVGARVEWRSAEIRSEIHGKPVQGGTMHLGTDIYGRIGSPIFAVEDGTVTGVSLIDSSIGNFWVRMVPNQHGPGPTEQQVYSGDADFEASIKASSGRAAFSGANLANREDAEEFPVGTFVKSVGIADAWYFVKPNTAGNRITISHGKNVSHYYHLDSLAPGIRYGQKVRAGQLIAYMGITGALKREFINKEWERVNALQQKSRHLKYVGTVSGPQDRFTDVEEERYVWQFVSETEDRGDWTHLHFEYWENFEDGVDRDPAYDFPDNLPEIPKENGGRVPVDPVPSYESSSPNSTTIQLAPKPEDIRGELFETLSEEEAKSVIDMLDSLWQDGWLYYDRDSSITNLWWKPFVLNYETSNDERDIEFKFSDDDVVITACAGGLRHVVANIPVIGHEYPTQQHLGSTEPFYTFEFCVLDNQGKDGQEFAGLSKNGELLMGMRTLLHANARKFRAVTDSWAVSCESFITRMLGSYKEGDRQVAPLEDADGIGEDDPVIDDAILRRRLLATRGSSMTVEGHPGLTCHTLEFSGTNPYEGEALTATAPQKIERDAARKTLLNRLYNHDFATKYRSFLTGIFLAQLGGAETNLLTSDDLGEFELRYIGNDSGAVSANEPRIALVNGQEYVVLGKGNEALGGILDLLGDGQVEDLSGTPFGDAFGIPLDTVFPEEFQSGTTYRTERVLSPNTSPGDWAYHLGKSTLIGGLGGLYGSAAGAATIKNLTSKEARIKYRRFDISDAINNSQEAQLASQIPFQKIIDYWHVVHQTIKTADRLLSEDSDQVLRGNMLPGGVTLDQARSELFDLPVTPSLFKYYQAYLEGIVEIYPRYAGASQAISLQPSPGVATKHLRQNLNWLHWHKPLTAEQREEIRITPAQGLLMFAENLGGTLGKNFGFALDTVQGILNRPMNPSLLKLAGEDISGVDGIYKNRFTANLDAVTHDVAKHYMWSLPLRSMALEKYWSQYVPHLMLGDILGSLVGDDGSPTFANNVEQLKLTAKSCGCFSQSPVTDMPIYVVDWQMARSSDDIESKLGLLDPALDESGKVKIPAARFDSDTFTFLFLNNVEGVWPYGSPFIWFVDEAQEQKKLKYFKDLLARYADDMMTDRNLLRAFGLESLANVFRRARIQGSPAYPDMDLPHHPYYGDIATTTPDFYMWNMYEDGDAHNNQTEELFYESMDQIVENCYRSIKRLENPSKKYSPNDDPYVLEPSNGEKLVLHQQFNAEATDGGGKHDRGHVAFPYAPSPDSSAAIAKEMTALSNKAAQAQDKAEQTRNKWGVQESSSGETVPSKSEVDKLTGTKVEQITVSNTEGPFGQGGGVNYPRRMSSAHYKQLYDEVQSIENMFGSRSGYLKQQDLTKEQKERQRGTTRQVQDDPSHRFGLEQIKLLARQSSHDIMGQKRSLRRAHPTFKLFFVEEDEFESRLLNFDDFFSYNGVTSFTVVQNRKSPADHAVITLLNVAGTLDGTKRDAVVDLDYYGDTRKIKIPQGGSRLGGDPQTQDTALDQPFGAVVLRPGLNVQLRVGYHNDPDMLEVMLNGRVVDVQWNTSGDRAEIMVQSFGTELVQVIKGTSYAEGEVEAFPTTHHLLGSMMLSPELAHFGRWEFGQLYQVGEGKDSRLDFYDYSKHHFLGQFKYSNATTKWFLDHPIITMAIAIGGGAALSVIPGVGKLLRPVARYGGRVPLLSGLLGRLGLTSRLGTRGFTRALLRQARRRGIRATGASTGVLAKDIAKVAAAERGRYQVLSAALRSAGGKQLGKELVKRSERILRVRTAQAVRAAGRGASVEDVARLMAKGEADAMNLLLKGQWLRNPLASLKLETSAMVSMIGWQPAKRVFGGVLNRTGTILGGVSVAALGVDFASEALLQPLYEATLQRIQAYFRSKQVSLFLSPQDDNLYAPHPKDYMNIHDSGWQKFWNDLQLWTVKASITAFLRDDEFANKVARWFNGEDPFDKRVPPEACEFKPIGTTIWDTFHEMSLRHPGWVYGARPYGSQFRYTMFFGVPSQRYWSRGADNEFIGRANDLSRVLESPDGEPEVTFDEYRLLYGDAILTDDGQELISVDELKKDLRAEAGLRAAEQGYAVTQLGRDFYMRETGGEGSIAVTLPAEESIRLKDGTVTRRKLLRSASGAEHPWTETDTPIEESSIYKTLVSELLGSRVLREYLSALDLRFKPFRRYHSIDSDLDIVWNGLISSENAVYNAVDITYYTDDNVNSVSGGELASALFKAHAFIPESDLRVMPMPANHNLRGYQMAMRYGVGTLLHTMREMYRGEIVLLGNARIRPWDIVIMTDGYNEMVGPVEVEQVVHTFSHETGFITEIKPGAVVIANEISSWPVLEALKTLTLAVKDVDESFLGLRADDAGLGFRGLDWILGFGAGGSQEYIDFLQDRADKLSPFDPFKTDDGSDFESIDELGTKIKKSGQSLVGGAALVAGALTAGVAMKGAPFILGKIPRYAAASGKHQWFFRRMIGGYAGLGAFGAVGAGGTMALAWASQITPSLAWLLGGPVLFLSCLRGDSIMLVPLMKNGNPIVSGLNLSDPSMIWNNFKGELGRWSDDVISGTRDLTELWRIYGQHAWRRLNNLNAKQGNAPLLDENYQVFADLTGDER